MLSRRAIAHLQRVNIWEKAPRAPFWNWHESIKKGHSFFLFAHKHLLIFLQIEQIELFGVPRGVIWGEMPDSDAIFLGGIFKGVRDWGGLVTLLCSTLKCSKVFLWALNVHMCLSVWPHAAFISRLNALGLAVYVWEGSSCPSLVLC